MISIIIPVLNEELTIHNLLTHLVDKAGDSNSLEIIIVDGGSVDDTGAVVHAFAKAYPQTSLQFLTAGKGRGTQMHAGSQIAKGEILYFLHADSYPPKNYDQHIIKAVENGNPAGCFRMRFMSWNWWLIIIGWFTRFSWRASRGGDQSQYITRGLYDKLGGYNTSIPIYEDYELIHRLYDNGTYHVIPKWLKTSARRYEEIGVYKLQWFYITIYWKKRNGATIDEIYEYYLDWCQPEKVIQTNSRN
ncbi:MAG: TIGR04283 family arsenosugar biosynthesis glycosyltransferase [Nonlabens sp.]|uniref:TIGR04283 family arsenosugar biosynthesis glycosyltransferase n=1 Tax=Nonlabens sp. TaxID=1888209 RepID=UPI003EF96698